MSLYSVGRGRVRRKAAGHNGDNMYDNHNNIEHDIHTNADAHRSKNSGTTGTGAHVDKRGWESIKDAAGVPYKALGEPILDFKWKKMSVLNYDKSKQKNQNQNNNNNNNSTNGNNNNNNNDNNVTTVGLSQAQIALQAQIAAEKQAAQMAKEAKQQKHALHNHYNQGNNTSSLDYSDPIRDLLALCTPRKYQ